MLQQTRAQTVVPYYERFLERFPRVEELAAAQEPELLACWSGLGYYERVRNLQRAARRIVESGGFPREFEDIRALPGVGAYTAAAVASIAFGLPHAVLDGNVLRVIARLGNDAGDIGSARTRERFRVVAGELLDRRRPGEWNQAVMELGATICLPREPRCGSCPAAPDCQARLAGCAAQLPVKLRKTGPVSIANTLFLMEREGRILLWQRAAGSSRLAGFWELPDKLPAGAHRGHVLGSFRHAITNHRYTFTVVSATVARAPAGMRWIAPHDLARMPLSTVARKALGLRPVRNL